MKYNRIVSLAVALGMVGHVSAASHAWAQQSGFIEKAPATAMSAIATLFLLPMKATTCAATVILGGAGYGFSVRNSEFVEDELIEGVPYACGGRYYVTPDDITSVMYTQQADEWLPAPPPPVPVASSVEANAADVDAARRAAEAAEAAAEAAWRAAEAAERAAEKSTRAFERSLLK